MLRACKLDSEEALLRLHNCFFEARRLEEAVDVQEELFALRRHVMRDCDIAQAMAWVAIVGNCSDCSCE